MTKERVEEVKFLTANTFIPITFVAVMAGAIFWVTVIYTNTSANTESIKDMRHAIGQDQKAINEKFDAIMRELSYLRGRRDGEQDRNKRGR